MRCIWRGFSRTWLTSGVTGFARSDQLLRRETSKGINNLLVLKKLDSSSPLISPAFISLNVTSNQLELLAADILKTQSHSRSTEAQSQRLCDIYKDADEETKWTFLYHFSATYGVDPDLVETAVQSYLKNKEKGESYVHKSAEKLRQSLTPGYMNLLNNIARLDDGVKFIVDLRADVLVSEYEAVHPIRSWADIKRRVGPYRRCYVFTHSCLPKEPLVILHVALTRDISVSIQDIVKNAPLRRSQETPQAAHSGPENSSQINAAIFYSISSPQRGLHGIELGTQMIREVGRRVRSEFPNITKFSSLSPIPGFRDYLVSQIQSVIRGDSQTVLNFVTSDEYAALEKYLLNREANYSQMWPILLKELRTNSWVHDEDLAKMLYSPLMRKCAHYLYNEKRRGNALNSVAHFHLRNGAVMWRLNWKADLTPRGWSNSCGIMINYRYYIEDVERNSQRYIEDKFVEASNTFLQHLQPTLLV